MCFYLNFVVCLLIFFYTISFAYSSYKCTHDFFISICTILYLLAYFTKAVNNTQIRSLEGNRTNSLNYVLNNDVGNSEESVEINKPVPYFHHEKIIQFCVYKRNQFTIL